ncbi:zinc finger MYM-type protein 5-like [Hydra vulgaris]|uniref:Zinc finger MYM-type protein 5-like n=1 Tax=Hydra vulgaris TaxID=6087 RepID=A0ABM4CA99_HYDVU
MSGIGKKSKLSGAQNKKNRLKREEARQMLSVINLIKTAAEENQDLNPETPSSSSGVSINQEINKIDFGSEKIDFNDPATWQKQINVKLRNRLMENDPKQLILKDFPKNKSGRKFSDNYYYRTLSNGEKFAGVICFIRKLII